VIPNNAISTTSSHGNPERGLRSPAFDACNGLRSALGAPPAAGPGPAADGALDGPEPAPDEWLPDVPEPPAVPDEEVPPAVVDVGRGDGAGGDDPPSTVMGTPTEPRSPDRS
jgi:hypothetical protein